MRTQHVARRENSGRALTHTFYLITMSLYILVFQPTLSSVFYSLYYSLGLHLSVAFSSTYTIPPAITTLFAYSLPPHTDIQPVLFSSFYLFSGVDSVLPRAFGRTAAHADMLLPRLRATTTCFWHATAARMRAHRRRAARRKKLSRFLRAPLPCMKTAFARFFASLRAAYARAFATGISFGHCDFLPRANNECLLRGWFVVTNGMRFGVISS